MKILLFVNNYLELYRSIEDELVKSGNEVSVIIDPCFENDPKQSSINKFNPKWEKLVNKFWLSHKEILRQKWDEFISINGCSINSYAISLIRKYNPNIQTSIYAWDSFNYVDFNLLATDFDYCYSFDINDCCNRTWKLLPPFWIRTNNNKNGLNYNLFCIGTNHDRRYFFIKQVLAQIKNIVSNNYIKIVIKPRRAISFFKELLLELLRNHSIRNTLFNQGFIDCNLSIKRAITPIEYMNYLTQSKIVIDDNRDSQAGLSPRFVWAMALKKKIITTNESCLKFSFVNQKNVIVVDKKRPCIDKNFLCKTNEPNDVYQSNVIDTLELRNWCKILLRQVELPNYTKAL